MNTKELNTIAALQAKFFNEYKTTCYTNPNIADDHLTRWEGVKDSIYDMNIQEQSEYADYVITRMSKLDKNIIASLAKFSFNSLPGTKKRLAACSIGNMALICVTIGKYPEYSDLSEKYTSILSTYCAEQTA